MPASKVHPVAAAHAQLITARSGTLANVLAALFRRQAGEVLARWRGRHFPRSVPSLDHYTGILTDYCQSLIRGHIVAGGQREARAIQQALADQKKKRRKKDSGTKPTISTGFDVFNPAVEEAARNLTLNFAASTNATSQGDLQAALDDLRGQIAEGLAEGEALKDLTARVQSIFDTPRASMIAATETSRAVHSGQLAQAKASGIVDKMEWLCSADACDDCLELDGMQVDVGDAFAVLDDGPYGTVEYPPLHPFCRCTIQSILNEDEEEEES